MATDWTTVVVAGITGTAGLGGGFVAAWAQHRSAAAQQRARRAVVRDLVEAVDLAATWRGRAADDGSAEDHLRLIGASAAARSVAPSSMWHEQLRPYVDLALSWSLPPGRAHPSPTGNGADDPDGLHQAFHEALDGLLDGGGT